MDAATPTSTPEAPRLAHPRTAGFRLSIVDGLVLVLGAIATAVSIGPLGPMAGLFPMAVGHFFLFCNVFRVRRRYELAWTAVFLVNFTLWTFTEFAWLGVLAIQLPVTAAAIALEIRSPHYHGIFATRLNPRLAEYLDGRIR